MSAIQNTQATAHVQLHCDTLLMAMAKMITAALIITLVCESLFLSVALCGIPIGSIALITVLSDRAKYEEIGKIAAMALATLLTLMAVPQESVLLLGLIGIALLSDSSHS